MDNVVSREDDPAFNRNAREAKPLCIIHDSGKYTKYEETNSILQFEGQVGGVLLLASYVGRYQAF